MSLRVVISMRARHNKKMVNKSFENVEQFKYLGTTTTLTDQIFTHEEIKSRLKSGNACCHSVQNPQSSSLLTKNIEIKIYRMNNFACYFVWA
jgi:hypothetical protein